MDIFWAALFWGYCLASAPAAVLLGLFIKKGHR